MITGKQYAQMIVSAANNLSNNKELLNELNVFPVPDGDTGKNMSMSIDGAKAAALEFSSDNSPISLVADKVAMATLRGARGNSGVILSQLLRGFAKETKGKTSLNEDAFAKCFKSAASTAYSAVMKPTEGTILTVARESGEAVEKSGDKASILSIMKTAYNAAEISLANTPNLLPKLKQAGVVDAGGKGWTLVLEGMLYYLEKGYVIEPLNDETKADVIKTDTSLDEDITFTYCTEFLIDKKTPDVDVSKFKSTISKIGDCMVVIEDFDIVKVHIHTDNPGIVIQNALKIGSLNDIKIDNMRFQHNEKYKDESNKKQEEKAEKKKSAVIAVSAGNGYSEIMKELGVSHIIEGGQTMNPSAGDILEAIHTVNAETVYILPNNKNIVLAAQAAKDMANENVVVISTSSVPQGISAMIIFDSELSPEQNLENMNDAAKAVENGSVTYAVRDSENNGIIIKKDDIIGLCKSGVIASGNDVNEIAFTVCENLINDETGLLTLYYGEEISSEQAQALGEKIEEKYPDIDVSVQYGGQPIYYYNIAAE